LESWEKPGLAAALARTARLAADPLSAADREKGEDFDPLASRPRAGAAFGATAPKVDTAGEISEAGKRSRYTLFGRVASEPPADRAPPRHAIGHAA
jgi:hypothetical protein